jgi:hypothetical protein
MLFLERAGENSGHEVSWWKLPASKEKRSHLGSPVVPVGIKYPLAQKDPDYFGRNDRVALLPVRG